MPSLSRIGHGDTHGDTRGDARGDAHGDAHEDTRREVDVLRALLEEELGGGNPDAARVDSIMARLDHINANTTTITSANDMSRYVHICVSTLVSEGYPNRV